jgi:hypothetical protein
MFAGPMPQLLCANIGKQWGTSKSMIPVPLIDLKSLVRIRHLRRRDFRSTVLVNPPPFAI